MDMLTTTARQLLLFGHTLAFAFAIVAVFREDVALLRARRVDAAKLEATGSSGGGLVSVTLGGRKDCRRVRIDPSAISDPEMLEDLVAAAFNDAVGKIDAESKAMMDSATAGMPLPPGMKLPF